MDEIKQLTLKLEPPYGSRFIQHLHHIELVYGKSEVKRIISWLLDLHTELVCQHIQSSPNQHRQCECKNGFILDQSRTNEVFPDGVPIKCPICHGVGYIEFNDIIDPNPVTERVLEIPNLEPETSEPTKYEI